MHRLHKPLALAGLLVAGALCANTVHAAPFVVTVSQQGGNVVATGNGAFDLTGLSGGVPQGCLGTGAGASFAVVSLGSGVDCDYYYTAGPFTGPGSFGSGGPVTASASTGDAVSIFPNASSLNVGGIGALLLVPTGYVSDSALSNTATWTGASLASLGMTSGTYTWTWGNGADQSFTLNILAAPPPPPPTPAYVVKIFQQGGDVVAVGSGGLDLTGLIGPQPVACSGGAIVPTMALIISGDSANCDSYRFPTSLPGPTSFGNGMGAYASSGTGDTVGFGGSAGAAFVVPDGYVSDALLSGTATWSNATFASLGLTPGTYNWNWGNGANQSFMVEIGNFSTGVPEPSAWALFGGGLLLLGAFLGLRRKQAA